MKHLLSIAILTIFFSHATARENTNNNSSPLSKYATEWDNPKYKVCNTAEHTPYLSETEKQIVYILNLARMNPKLFCSSVLLNIHKVTRFIDTSSEVYYKSLVMRMAHMDPLKILAPDSLCYVSAQCHAASSGKTGYVGHDRRTAECRKKEYFRGECCQYGVDDPLEIILCLLVDDGVPSLGHRNICLGTYSKMSPSFGPHKTFEYVAVLDFYH